MKDRAIQQFNNQAIQQFSNSTIKYFCPVSIIFYLLFFISVVSAQEQPKQSALGVSPAILELVLDPGKKSEAKVTVINVTNFPLPIKASAKNFNLNEEILGEGKEIFDASSWIKIEPADFILQPLENKEIIITVSTPKKAPPGGHYATVYFQPLIPVEVLSPQTTYLAAKVGVLNFFIVRGEIKEKMIVSNFEILKTSRQFGPVDLKFKLINEGNVHLSPLIEASFFNTKGKKVYSAKLDQIIILPKTAKEIGLSWPKKYLFGKYSAQVNILYGSEHQKLESEKIIFWIVPWRYILVSIILLTTVVYFIIIVRKRFFLAVKVLLGKAEVWELKRIRLDKK